jgi:hypothetical protein
MTQHRLVVMDVSGQHIGENGTDNLSRIAGSCQATLCNIPDGRRAHTAAGPWNHVNSDSVTRSVQLLKLQTLYSSPLFCYASEAKWLLSEHPDLKFKNPTFCPHSVFVCFVWISEQTAIISLHSIKWLVFTTETECVYCAVRTESLYTIQVHLVFTGLRRTVLETNSTKRTALLCEVQRSITPPPHNSHRDCTSNHVAPHHT